MQGKFRLRYIFICLLAVLLMSHNVGAIGLNLDVRYVRSHVGTISANLPSSCRYTATGGVQGTSNDCMFSNPTVATGYGEYLAGDIIEIDFIFLIVAVNDSIDAWAYDIKPVSLGDNTNIAYLGQSFEQLNGSEGMMKYYIRVNSYSNNTYGVSFTGNIHLYNNEYFNSMVSTWRINNVDLSTINSNLQGVIEAIEDSAESSSEYQEKEQQAIENIENQTTQDISQSGSTENAQTSSLLQTVGGLLTALQSMQAGSCSVQLPLPNFAGGSITVNICQGKDKTGNLVSIFGSVALIVFYIPLAWKLISMIYSEIRSFTNG